MVSSSGFAAPAFVPALVKTRVWGFGLNSSPSDSGWAAVSSTSRWGYLPGYDRIASDRLDQRYFAGTGAGRFLSADPFRPTLCDKDTNLNRFGYVEGDPINRHDPEGLFSADPAGQSLDDWLAFMSSVPSIADPTDWRTEPDLPFITLSRIQFPANWSYECTDWTCNELTLRMPEDDWISLAGSNSFAQVIVVPIGIGVSTVGQVVIAGVAAYLTIQAIEWWRANRAQPRTERCAEVLKDCKQDCIRLIPTGEASGAPFFNCVSKCYRAGGC